MLRFFGRNSRSGSSDRSRELRLRSRRKITRKGSSSCKSGGRSSSSSRQGQGQEKVQGEKAQEKTVQEKVQEQEKIQIFYPLSPPFSRELARLRLGSPTRLLGYFQPQLHPP